ncbi:relaxase/mobilization nuclease domain-containing protein [Nocardia sp. alder85J]|uniref:relaxase/mobilization nuclease domain-containing protein n=1 Tax=Nocardia sp. alder85J TaxID=2862949 RepID=UPI001CD74AFB|nr:hypothetical protein [Nocardia sp. alder85J]MCX4099262.1 hypothetical protein [Nocardia sp. alder85J]
MMPNTTKGSDIKKLLWYLAGPGRANEHTDPTVVAGDIVTMSVFGGAIDQRRAWELGRLLDSPRQTLLRGEPVAVTSYKKAKALMAEGMSKAAAFEAATSDANTWHCSLALRAEEGELGYARWSQIARDFMREMGFIDRGDGAPDVRWAAVHHGRSTNGNDHIHIAMPIVRSDGSLANVFRDRPRSQAAARVLERKYGLQVLHTREYGDTEQATKPAERARAERVGAPETDREALRRRVRGAAAAADSEAEWLRLLHAEGVKVIPRWAPGGMEEVVGYSVELPRQRNTVTGEWEKAIRYSGLRLDKDLSLPALRDWAPWSQSAAARDDALEEWRRTTRGANERPIEAGAMSARGAIRELRWWTEEMRRIPVGDRDGWARAASSAAGLFAAASVRTERGPGPLDRLSRQLARAGQLPAHQRRPRSRGSRPTRGAAVARMLWSPEATRAPGTAVNIALIYALTSLLLAVRDSLDAQSRAVAAAAMASTARRALTEIHMRADGIDPARPYTREPGSPAWAAAARSSIVVDRLDRDQVEAQIRDAADAWNRQRAVAAGDARAEQYDDKGHIVAARPWSSRAASAAAGPLTPPPGATPPAPGTGRTAGRPPGTDPGSRHGRRRGFER